MFSNPMGNYNTVVANAGILDQSYRRHQQEMSDNNNYQNALVQQAQEEFPDRADQLSNYGSVQAMQDHAKQTWTQYAPILQSAMATGNNDIRNKIAESMVSSKNPFLAQSGQVIQKMDFVGNKNFGLPVGYLINMGDNELAPYGLDKEQLTKFGTDDVLYFKPGPGGTFQMADFKQGKLPPADKTSVTLSLDTPKEWESAYGRTDISPAVKKSLLTIDPEKGYLVKFNGLKDGVYTGVDLKPPKKSSAHGAGGWEASDEDVRAAARAVLEKRRTLGSVEARGGLRTRVQAEVERLSRAEGMEPINYNADETDAKSARASQVFTTKQMDATESFLRTIDNNIGQLEDHIKQFASRHGMDENRVLNMGIRAFNEKLIGDADFNIYDMLTSAISTENAKLQAGGAQSVAQVAEGMRTDMGRIHDKNLPVSEMLKLMRATRREGENRKRAISDQLETTRERSRETRRRPSEYKVGDLYKGRKILRLGWEGKKRYAKIEGAALPVELK